MGKKILICALVTLLNAGLALAQSTVSGKVSDAGTGEGIPFVAIMVKNSTVGTSSDADGMYSIQAGPQATLVFSAIGYTPREIPVQNRSTINISLQPDKEFIEGTVIIGYGSAKKLSTVVGSAATIKKNVLENRPVASVADALQGQVAGLQVFTSSGEPSASVSMRLRGVNSINASNTPLFILDGSPVSSSVFYAINPNDIENIVVLKDASSTSIYGSRAANGVVYITTRRGSGEKTSIRLNASYGISSLASYPVKMTTSKEYFELREIVDPSLKDNADFQELKQFRLSRPDLFNFNWRKWIINENAPTKNIDLSISGRSKTTDYYLSANAFDQQGIEYDSYLRRFGIRSNINSYVNNWLKFGANIAITYQPQMTQGYSSGNSWYNPVSIAYWSLPYTTPYGLVYDENGNFKGLTPEEQDYMEDSGRYNYYFLMRLQPRSRNYMRLHANTHAEITPFKNFILKASQAVEGYDYRSSSKALPREGSPFAASANESFTRFYRMTLTNTAEYKFSLADQHDFTILLGQEAIVSRSNGFGASSEGQTDERLQEINKGTTPGMPSYSLSEESYNSYFSRFNYDCLGRYALEVSFRRDGSSLFGSNRRWANFWAVGAMWNIKKESWLSDTEWLNQLQIRMNYGTTGNSGIDNYLSLGLVGTSTKYQGNQTLGLSQVANPDLTWETVTSLNLGTTARFLDRISITVDLYRKVTGNMLMQIPYSYATGFGSGWGNVGSMTNKGVEVDINMDILRSGDWYVNYSVNFGYNKNTITELFGGRDEFIVPNTGVKYQVGKTYGDFYFVRFRGVDPATGAPLYERPDGTLTSKYSAEDAQFLGKNRYAPWSGGFQLNASWKGLSINATFSGVFGKWLYNNDRYFLESPSFITSHNLSARVFNIWTKPGDVTDIPGAQYEVKNGTSRFLENASFVRLKNLQISYTFPTKWVNATGVLSGLRIYVIGRNLLTFTKYTGYDPEIDSNLSLGNYPNTKQYSAGIELTF